MTKKILHLIIFLCATTLGFSQTTATMADWDGTDLAMVNSFGNGHFSDSLFAIVANPNPSGINMSANVQNWQKADNANTWGGFFYDPSETIDLTAGSGQICVDVYAEHEFTLRLKVEKEVGQVAAGTNNIKGSFDQCYLKEGEWQQLCFNLLGQDVGSANTVSGFEFTRLTLFPEFGNVPATDTSYYFDNITKTTGGPFAPSANILADWDGTDLAMVNSFGNGHFSDSLFAIVANPNPSGINMSANVQNWQKADNANTWGGFFYNPSSNIDLTGSFGEICVDVYAEHEFTLRLKVEKEVGQVAAGTNNIKGSFDQCYLKEGEWQQICFNLLGQDVGGMNTVSGFQFTRLTLFPEFGNTPATDTSYYFDNITIVSGAAAGTLPPDGQWISDYEIGGVTVPMVSSFGNGDTYGGNLFPIVVNPTMDAINPSDSVQMWCKGNSGDNTQVWAGWTLGAIDTLNFTGTKATICVSVLADSESLIRLKLEDSPTGEDLRIDQNYTTPGEWQNLCFDFTQPDVNGNIGLGHLYYTIVFFPEYNTVPAANKCFHLDNIYKVTDGVGDPDVFISDVIKESADHTIFEELLTLTDLWGAVDAADATVFAPTDAAFNALPAGELADLQNNVDNAAYNLVLFHITKGALATGDLTMGMELIMNNGYDAVVTAGNSAVSNATISEGDVGNSNGTLHFTSGVMEYANPAPASYLFEDFEGDFTGNQWAGFNWGSATANQWVEANPAPDAVNGSAMVMRSRKYPTDFGPSDFQGIVVRDMHRRMNFIGTNTQVCVDVYFPEVGSRFRWKFEKGLINNTDLRYEASNTVANEWEKICVDVTEASLTDPFTPAAGNIYPQLAIFFDYTFGEFPAAETDYFFDNLEVYNTLIDGTQDVSELENFEMFPNPAQEFLTIKTDSPVEYAVVYGVSGLQMMLVENPLGKDMNVANLPAGIYYIQFLSKDAVQMGVAKFVKQ